MMIKNDWRFPSVGCANLPPRPTAGQLLCHAASRAPQPLHLYPHRAYQWEARDRKPRGVVSAPLYWLLWHFYSERKDVQQRSCFFNRLGARGRNVLRNHNLKNSVPTCCVTSSSKNCYYIRNDSWAETQDYSKNNIFWPWEILFKTQRYSPTEGARQTVWDSRKRCLSQESLSKGLDIY